MIIFQSEYGTCIWDNIPRRAVIPLTINEADCDGVELKELKKNSTELIE